MQLIWNVFWEALGGGSVDNGGQLGPFYSSSLLFSVIEVSFIWLRQCWNFWYIANQYFLFPSKYSWYHTLLSSRSRESSQCQWTLSWYSSKWTLETLSHVQDSNIRHRWREEGVRTLTDWISDVIFVHTIRLKGAVKWHNIGKVVEKALRSR